MKNTVFAQALQLLACEVHLLDVLTDPNAVKDFPLLKLADRPHEVFAVIILDAQHRVIDVQEMFRSTLTQTNVYPREAIIESLNRNAANDTSGFTMLDGLGYVVLRQQVEGTITEAIVSTGRVAIT